MQQEFNRKSLSIIVPCYNESAIIEPSYDRVKTALGNGQISDHEIIFVDDGSQDDSLIKLSDIARGDSRVKIISFSRNFGHQAAITAGLMNASKDHAVIIDADMQDPPELIPEMMDIMRDKKCSVVYGVRRTRQKENVFKLLTAKLFYRVLNYLSDVKLPLDTGDFRLIDRSVLNAFRSFPEKNKYIRGLISWVGFKQCPIYYDRSARIAGETKYSMGKMVKLASTGVFYFSKKPLQLAINLGFLSLLIALSLIVYVVLAKILVPSSTISGWASLLISVIFFGGVQLLTIGIIGLYIGNIFDETKARPPYIIDKTINL